MSRLLAPFLILVLLTAGCTRGPSSPTLQKEIQEKLDTRFKEGLFQVQQLSRSGSYPYTEKGDPTRRLVVYFVPMFVGGVLVVKRIGRRGFEAKR